MTIDKQSSGEDFLLDGQVIEEVSEFGYLGSLINTKSDSTTEIKCRLAIARTTTQNMLNIWKSRGLSIDLKLKFLRATAFLLSHTAVSHGHQLKMTTKGLRPLNFGATEDFSGYPGRIKEPTTGCWRRLAPHSSLETQ